MGTSCTCLGTILEGLLLIASVFNTVWFVSCPFAPIPGSTVNSPLPCLLIQLGVELATAGLNPCCQAKKRRTTKSGTVKLIVMMSILVSKVR